MHRSVLEAEEFIEWANENVVVLVAHPKGGHKKVDVAKPAKGEPKEQCSLYPGISCDMHDQAFKDLTGKDGPGSSKDDKEKKPAPKSKKGEPKEELPRAEVKGYPNSFVITPDGKVEKHGADRKPDSCRDLLLEKQKAFDENPIAASKWADVSKAWADAEKAAKDGKWKPALDAMAKAEAAAGGKLPKALVEKEKAKVEALNAKVAQRFGDLKKGKDVAAAAKAIQALHDDANVTLLAGPLPVVEDIAVWLREHAPAEPAK